MRIFPKVLISLVFLLNSCQKTPQAPVSSPESVSEKVKEVRIEPTAIKIGELELTENSLKSELQIYTISDYTSFDSSLNDLIYRKRVYLEARNKGYGQSANDKEEIETYQGILAKDYLLDSTLLNYMIDEAYDHLKEEINASHIFVSFSEDSEPKDSSFVYDELMRIRSIALESDSFDSLAHIYSQDKTTASKGGELGWFSALQMYYPIELGAYDLEIGQVSLPIRSQQGYHLIKLNDRRAALGSISVKHLLKAIPDWGNVAFVSSQKAAIDSIRNLISGGASFDELIVKESDDKASVRDGGKLPSFSVGTRAEVEFEKTAFQLQNDEISSVVKTSVGYHIIQVINRRPIPAKVQLYDYLKNKVKTDSRGEWLETNILKSSKEKLKYTLDPTVYQRILSKVDVNILSGKWTCEDEGLSKETLIRLNEERILAGSFIDFMIDRQMYDASPDGYNSQMAARRYFRIFEKILIKEKAEQMASTWNPELATQVQLIKESMVTSDFLNDYIFEKSIADSLGQRRYYDRNKEKYVREPRRYALVITGNERSFIETVQEQFQMEKPYRLKRGIHPIYFSKNYYSLSEEDKTRLNGLVALLDKNNDYIVEVGGHIDVAEEDYLSSARIKAVVSYLTSIGLAITRIQEYDYLKTQPADRFDWSKNQRVSIQFFSNNELDLLPSIDPNKKNLLSVEKKWFNKSNERVWELEVGEAGIAEESSELFAYYQIIKEQEAGYLSLREAKASVISDFQNELETKLKRELAQKYPLNENTSILRILKEQLLLQN